jgi:hypothetical protein
MQNRPSDIRQETHKCSPKPASARRTRRLPSALLYPSRTVQLRPDVSHRRRECRGRMGSVTGQCHLRRMQPRTLGERKLTAKARTEQSSALPRCAWLSNTVREIEYQFLQLIIVTIPPISPDYCHGFRIGFIIKGYRPPLIPTFQVSGRDDHLLHDYIALPVAHAP